MPITRCAGYDRLCPICRSAEILCLVLVYRGLGGRNPWNTHTGGTERGSAPTRWWRLILKEVDGRGRREVGGHVNADSVCLLFTDLVCPLFNVGVSAPSHPPPSATAPPRTPDKSRDPRSAPARQPVRPRKIRRVPSGPVRASGMYWGFRIRTKSCGLPACRGPALRA